MKVSVLITTYNQEEFIAQAVNSVLMQQVAFDYEIIIGEDVSTDRTREIVLDLEKKFPGKIRVFLREAEQAERDRASGWGGKTNFISGLAACQGEYVALLDGDDYWTDSGKLQKQVNFLDRHPEVAICYHNATMLFENEEREPRNLLPPDHKANSNLSDLLLENFIPTCSTLFRRGLFGKLPDWFHSLKLGDWPLLIVNARHGRLGYINEVMGVYRYHRGGFWSRQDHEQQVLEIIRMLECVRSYLGPAYKKDIGAAQAHWYYYLAQQSYGRGDQRQSRHFLRKYLWLRGRKGPKELVELFLRLRAPSVYQYFRTQRRESDSDTSPSSTIQSS